jgi:type II secretory pathway pseudopilin PulG
MAKHIFRRLKKILTGGGEKGTSLVEVLVALLLLQILMLGILQMFSMAFVINKGSEARTDMTYEAQQLLENLRYLNSLYKINPTLLSSYDLSPVSFPLTAGSTYDFTTVSNLSTSYWGPSKANVLSIDNQRYQVYASVSDGGADWSVTVTVRADPTQTSFLKGKVIEYAAQLPK